MRKARTAQSRAMAGSAFSRGNACKFTTWSLKGMVGTLGTYPGRGLRTTWESAGPNSRHESSTENACRSPILLTVANAERSTVFRDRNLSSTDCRGSKGAPLKADRTEGDPKRVPGEDAEDLASLPLWGTWWPGRVSPETYRLLHHDVRR